MLARLRPRSVYDVIALLALFVAVGGGTAFALVGANQVNSQSIINGQVKNQDLAPNSVGTGKVIDHTLTGNDLANGAVGPAQLAPNSVDSSKVADGTLTGADIANLAVNTPQLQDLAVVGSKLANGAVDTSKLADAAVTTPKLANHAVSSAKLGLFSVGGFTVKTGGVNSRAIADRAITNTDIKFGTVTDFELRPEPGIGLRTLGGQLISTSNKCDTLHWGSTPDYGNTSQMFDPNSNNTVVKIPQEGLYLVTTSVGWAEDGGTYATFLRKGGTVLSSGNAHDGDDQTVTTVVTLAAGDRVNVRVCWSGFGSSRTVTGATLAVQRFAGFTTAIPIGPRARAR